MAGSFILSLDCEGKWGVADHLGGICQGITGRALDSAYSFIFEILDKYNLRASFAFTSMFTVGSEVIEAYRTDFENMASDGHDWFRPIAQMAKSRDYDGWLGDRYFDYARSRGHEISWHGFSHHSLDSNCNAQVLQFEILNGLKIAQEQGHKLRSLVFPRNGVGNLESLAQAGFSAYRLSKQQISPLHAHPLFRLINEFNILEISQSKPKASNLGITGIPPGEFLNWPSGARAYIPARVTIRRWKHILNDATGRSGCAHLWFHPHNLITAPAMRPLFERAMQEVADRVRDGRLVNMTLDEYSELCEGVEP